MRFLRFQHVVLVATFMFGFGAGCGGGCGGCSSMEPLPSGFPADKRHPNAAQVRVSQTGLAAVTADPAALVAGVIGGPLSFNLPATCGGNPELCCPGGVPQTTCGPLDIDLMRYTAQGDDPRLVITPTASGAIDGNLGVTVRARLKTASDIPVHIQTTVLGIPVEADCLVAIDTQPGNEQDLEIVIPVQFRQDAQAGTTRLGSGTVQVNRLENDDIELKGSLTCQGANFVIGSFLDTLKTAVADQIQSALSTQTCKACASGDVAECGEFATACTDNVCMKSTDTCLQEIGLAGRLRNVLPGATGALDLYEVLGGYATTNSNGLALGLLGGMQPSGAARDRCGPPATEPTTAAIPQSTAFQGNVDPDGMPFGVGIGVHKSQLTQFAFAGYDGGLLCITIGHDTVDQLNTDTIGLLSRSLTKLVDLPAPVAVGLRPQSPPEIILGRNTFKPDGTVDVPLLDITFHQMEIDFFAQVEDQYIRVFTVVSDVHLPIGLQVTAMGELGPVLGDTANAFTNLSVKNSDAVTESPADLAGLFPNLLNLILPQLSGALPSVALPAIAGLTLSVTKITSVDNDAFMAIFANLVTGAAPRPVTTRAQIVAIEEPSAELLAHPRLWAGAQPPAVTLELGGEQPGLGSVPLEYSVRTDRGAWSGWNTNARPMIKPSTFWLQGTHVIEVRARELGKPETIDPTPELIAIELGTGTRVLARTGINEFHGAPGEAGCNCEVGGTSSDALPLAVAFGFLVLPLRRNRRRVLRRVGRTLRTLARHACVLGPIVWLAALAALPGCSCSANPCGDVDCLPGEIEHGAIGKWTSIAGDGDRVLVATYDKGLGDLVVVDVTDPANPVVVAVDGIPGVTPIHDPSGYRKGIDEPGPDVGANTSITLGEGLARVAYQDRDAKQLRFALETKRDEWLSYVLDAGDGEETGRHTAITIDGSGNPAVAYLAVGIDDGSGHRTTELRVARATDASPASDAEWTTVVVATGIGSCAGLCGDSGTCIAGDGGERCAVATSDCTATCGDTQTCVSGACVDTIADPTVADLPAGTGLFPSLVALPDGRLAVVFHDRIARSLVLAVESAAGSGSFQTLDLDAATPGNRGMWADATVDGSGTIHVAYQDAVGDQLMYTTWNGTIGIPEVVDDGQRTGDRTHPVGAGASIYLVNGTPTIAYQDGLAADVYIATRAGAAWATTAFATGPLLDGFSIAATTGHGAPYLAWDQLVPANSPPNGLIVKTN